MRKRTLLALVAGLALGTLLLPAAAQAATGPSSGRQAGSETIDVSTKPKETNKELFDCSKEVVEGTKTVEDCQKAPSIILPATNELIWGALAFVVLFVLLWKFAWPGIKTGLETRSNRIRDDVEAAEAAKLEAQQTQAAYQAQLAEAKAEGARIIEEARQTADATRTERARALDEEITEMRRRAAGEIEAAKTQALADLRGEVANIAIGAAEHVVEQNLDAEANRRLVENFIAQVGVDR